MLYNSVLKKAECFLVLYRLAARLKAAPVCFLLRRRLASAKETLLGKINISKAGVRIECCSPSIVRGATKHVTEEYLMAFPWKNHLFGWFQHVYVVILFLNRGIFPLNQLLIGRPVNKWSVSPLSYPSAQWHWPSGSKSELHHWSRWWGHANRSE